ncbi:MAG: peptidoglycan bridge formation glycyltransferase FemA/FemB family protein [Ktedonobacteraceae bacterium]
MLHRYMLRAVDARQRDLWDNFVTSHSRGHFLQSWGWGDLKAGVGWHPLRLALWDSRREQRVAGAQILRRTVARMPPRLGHLAYIPRGPLLDWSRREEADHDQAELSKVFFAQLLPFLRAQGAIALHVELPLESDEEDGMQASKVLTALQFHPTRPVQPMRTIKLDLTPDEDSLLANMKEKWRYNIRLATRRGVQVRAASALEDVRAWYSLLQITGKRDGFGIHAFDYYRQAWQLFAPRQQAQLLLAVYEGHLLAGIFVGCMARQAIYLYGASGNEYRNMMPNYLLQWEAIRWAKSQGATSYDFWGIPETDDAEEAMAGVYRFKSGWGGQIVRFAGNYEYDFHPLAVRLARKFFPTGQ